MDTPTRTALPWPSLLVLAGATFVMVTGEMLPTAALPQMSADLGVSPARTGLLVSLWAATVVVASFPLVRLTARFDRVTVVTWALVAFAASGAVTAAAPSYAVAAGGRLLGAAVCGLLWATVNAHVADVVGDGLLARGVAVVLGGATLGTVVGVPLASVVAQAWDWRAGFAALAVLGLVAAVLVRRVVVRRPADDGRTGSATAVAAPAGDGSRDGLRAALVVAGLVGLVLVGHFAVFTFVTRLVPADGVPGGAGGVLLLLGAASAVAVLGVGRFGDRRPALALTGTAVVAAVAIAALRLSDVHPAAAVVVVAVWGLATGALPPLAQTSILRLAGPAHRTTAGTVIPVVLNLGIAVGAAAGSGLVAQAGVAALPVPAATVVALAAVGLGVAAVRRARPGRVRAEVAARLAPVKAGGGGRADAPVEPDACPA